MSLGFGCWVALLNVGAIFHNGFDIPAFNRTQDYAYRIPVDGWLLALPCLGILLVAVLTILMRTLNAALANPVKSLRHE